jgi:hypothetical protein
MSHALLVRPKDGLAIPGWPRKFNLASGLRASLRDGFEAGAALQAVDAANAPLYKGGNGGGRNPAAAFL